MLGVRVVELGSVLAVPYAAQVLAEMGADVMKVEPPAGDPARRIGPFRGEQSLYFASVNAGKRSVVLDLTEQDDYEKLRLLLSKCDVLIHNLRPSAALRLRLSPEDLASSHPDLVTVSIIGYASSSERGNDPALDLTIQAEAGLMDLTGFPGAPPFRIGVPITDVAAGLWAVISVFEGLERRSNGESGVRIEVPMLDIGAALLSYVGVGAINTGVDPDRIGSGHQEACPYGAFEAIDGWVVIAIIGDKFWPRMCYALGMDDWVLREELSANSGRAANRADVEAAVSQSVARLTVTEVVERLSAVDVPHAPVRTVLQALRSGYLSTRPVLRDGMLADGQVYRRIGTPTSSAEQRLRVPNLGEHTEAVLRAASRSGDAMWPSVSSGINRDS